MEYLRGPPKVDAGTTSLPVLRGAVRAFSAALQAVCIYQNRHLLCMVMLRPGITALVDGDAPLAQIVLGRLDVLR